MKCKNLWYTGDQNRWHTGSVLCPPPQKLAEVIEGNRGGSASEEGLASAKCTTVFLGQIELVGHMWYCIWDVVYCPGHHTLVRIKNPRVLEGRYILFFWGNKWSSKWGVRMKLFLWTRYSIAAYCGIACTFLWSILSSLQLETGWRTRWTTGLTWYGNVYVTRQMPANWKEIVETLLQWLTRWEGLSHRKDFKEPTLFSFFKWQGQKEKWSNCPQKIEASRSGKKGEYLEERRELNFRQNIKKKCPINKVC